MSSNRSLLLLLLTLYVLGVMRQAAAIAAAAEGGDNNKEWVISKWRRDKNLTPCFGCTEGEPMVYKRMFEDCSFFSKYYYQLCPNEDDD